jgi:hypothetical protein
MRLISISPGWINDDQYGIRIIRSTAGAFSLAQRYSTTVMIRNGQMGRRWVIGSAMRHLTNNHVPMNAK